MQEALLSKLELIAPSEIPFLFQTVNSNEEEKDFYEHLV
jgi:hypothetical protein